MHVNTVVLQNAMLWACCERAWQNQRGKHMRIKTIAVGLLSAQEAEWLIPAACELATRYGAHLIGVRPVEPYMPYVALEVGMGEGSVPMFFEWQETETAAIKERFEHYTGQQNFASEWRAQPVTAVGAEEYLVDSIRAADLVVLGQVDPKAVRRDHSRMQEWAIRQAGRPVLMLPMGRKLGVLGKNVLIGWSNTREATRAAHDALDLMAKAAKVDILRVGHGGGIQEDVCRDLAAMLDRHGMVPQILQREISETVGETLTDVALQQGSDLIVTGAFGHSRLYDFVIGAATRSLLETMKVPVLFSK